MAGNLANLRPITDELRNKTKGGRPKIAAFRRALKRVFLAKEQAAHMTVGGSASLKIDRLLLLTYDKLCVLVGECKSINELMAIQPFYQFVMDAMDGKELVPKADAVATKEHKTYLVGGEITRTEEVQTITQTAEITGAQDDEG